MSELIMCNRCGKLTAKDSSGVPMNKICLDDHSGHSTFHICERCTSAFYTDFFKWVWKTEEEQYVPKEEFYVTTKKR